MKRLILYIACLLVAVSAVAQVDVSGRVVDKENTEPLPGASVVVKGADGKINLKSATIIQYTIKGRFMSR